MSSNAIKIRLMTDDVSGIALWPDVAWDFPGSPIENLFDSDEAERLLPISSTLRDDIRAWVDDYTDSIHQSLPLDLLEHDRRGYRLSQELQRGLGTKFAIRYEFETDEIRREVRDGRRR